MDMAININKAILHILDFRLELTVFPVALEIGSSGVFDFYDETPGEIL